MSAILDDRGPNINITQRLWKLERLQLKLQLSYKRSKTLKSIGSETDQINKNEDQSETFQVRQ